MLKLSQYPTPTAGVCLGFSGIILFWVMIITNTNIITWLLFVGFLISAILLLPILFKFICYPQQLVAELQHPTIGSVIPTLAMTLMLLSHFIGLVSPVFAIVLWCFAIIAHAVFFSVFICHRLKNFNIDDIVPSWFVPPIGIVVACLVVPSPSLTPIAYILVFFGIVSYIILLPIMLYRLSLGSKIENLRKPTLAVLAAPASLSLAGYLTIIITPNPLLVLLLAAIALLMTISVYLMLIHLLQLPYSPAYSALTFPLAISATAMLKFSQWAALHPLLCQYENLIYDFSITEAVVASVVIFYVLFKTLNFIAKSQ